MSLVIAASCNTNTVKTGQDRYQYDKQRSVRHGWVMPVPLRTLKGVADGLGMPLAPASRRDTSGIQRGRNPPQRRSTSPLRLPDNGQDVGRKPIRLC